MFLTLAGLLLIAWGALVAFADSMRTVPTGSGARQFRWFLLAGLILIGAQMGVWAGWW